MLRLIERVGQDERGATAVEYGLIISLVILALVTALSNLANTTTSMWNNVSNEVETHT